jgi:GNAT superfamily N-acetyltransferase
MKVIEAKRGTTDARDFLRLPFSLYRNTPQWVPPLMPGERRRFEPDFSFYTHSEAAFFLARDEAGTAIGRMAVLNHRPHNEYRKAQDALLYLYECADDAQAAGLLFEAAAGWAQSRGLKRLIGPKGFLTAGDGLGLLIEGFEHMPAFGIPYNPPYYVKHWEQIGGMVKAVDYVSVDLGREGYAYPQELFDLSERIKARRGFSVPDFKSKEQVLVHARKMQEAYNSAFAPLWSYTPIPDIDMQGLIDKMLTVADPSMLKLVFKGDEVVGFVFAYPDLGAGLQRAKGEIWPFGWLQLLLEKRRTRLININGAAVLPKFQGLGVNVVVFAEIARTLTDAIQYNRAEMIQIQEDNFKMLSDISRMMPMKITKRHRIYSKEL